MKMKTLYAALSGVFLLGAATIAPAQQVPSEPAKAVLPSSMENKRAGISNEEYKAQKDRVEAEAKAAKEACQSLKGNAEDICEAEAKGKEKLAKKELDYRKNPNEKNARDVEMMKAEVAYEIAKEQCEDQKGADQANCKRDAKAEKDRAVAAVKGKKVASASTSRTNGGIARSSDTPTSSSPSGNISNTMSPGGREPSPNTNVQTQGTSTGVATGETPKPAEKQSPGK